MDTSTVIFLLIGWYCSSLFSFWYWFIREYKVVEIAYYYVAFFVGFCGPLTWVIGYVSYEFRQGRR
jgi:hypothetical protein